MALRSGSDEALETRGASSGLSTDLPPSTTLPPGPRRIRDRLGARRLAASAWPR